MLRHFNESRDTSGPVIGAPIAATDPRAGAAGSVFQVLHDPHLNHRVEVQSGVLAQDCADLLRAFFRARR